MYPGEVSAQSRVTYSTRVQSTELGNAIVQGIGSLFKKKDKSNSKKRNRKKDVVTDDVPSDASNVRVKKKDKKGNSTIEQGDVELVATGDGATKQEATLSALRGALEQVYGTMVSSNTKILNDELVKDEIVSISTGIVKKYTYLSEKEVEGKFYVVIKALVTPQKLITYAKQKGASTELAGATFAANMRLQELNKKNARIAWYNIAEMQKVFFPNCLDFAIAEMSEPKGRDNHYTVSLEVVVRLNSNAKQIQDLETQKPDDNHTGGGCGTKAEELLYSVFDKFKIVDNLNEYYLKHPPVYSEGKYIVKINKKAIVPNSAYAQFHTKYGKLRSEDDALDWTSDAIHFGNVIWEKIIPNKVVLVIPIEFNYTLDELEKITGIHVTLN